MKTRAVIALGANLGDKEKTISRAQKQIGKLRGVELVANSKSTAPTPSLSRVSIQMSRSI